MVRSNIYGEQSKNANILTNSLKWRLIIGLALLVWVGGIVINAKFMRLHHSNYEDEITPMLNFYASIIITLWLTVRFQFLLNNCPYFIWIGILSILGVVIPMIELSADMGFINIGEIKLFNMDKTYFFNILFLAWETIVVAIFSLINTHRKKIAAVFFILDLSFLAVISIISNLFSSKYALIPLFTVALAFVMLQFYITNIIYNEGYIWTELSIILIVGVIGIQMNVPLLWKKPLDISNLSLISLILLVFIVPLIISLIFKMIGKYNQVISFSPMIFMPLICLTIFYLRGDSDEVDNIKFMAYGLFVIFYLFLHISKIAYKTIQKRAMIFIFLVWIHLFILVLVLGYFTKEEILLATGLYQNLISTIIIGFSTSLIATISTVIDLRWFTKRNKIEEKIGD